MKTNPERYNAIAELFNIAYHGTSNVFKDKEAQEVAHQQHICCDSDFSNGGRCKKYYKQIYFSVDAITVGFNQLTAQDPERSVRLFFRQP